MNREIFETDDGSSSIQATAMGVTYHSRYGAVSESMHVFITAGFSYWNEFNKQQTSCSIFEMGLGTGLNALLTLKEAEKLQRTIFYHAIEAHPLEMEIIDQLNYCDQIQRPDLREAFHELHHSPWEREISMTPYFHFKKTNIDLLDFSAPPSFNIIYFDAFAPNSQPELWTKEIFQKLYEMLLPGGLLVTYCSKGEVQRAMKAAGLIVEKLPGPPGKREMIRAKRIENKDQSKV